MPYLAPDDPDVDAQLARMPPVVPQSAAAPHAVVVAGLSEAGMGYAAYSAARLELEAWISANCAGKWFARHRGDPFDPESGTEYRFSVLGDAARFRLRCG